MGISQQQALDCFASDDLIGIGMEADAVRRRLHPEGVVSYGVDRTFDLCHDSAGWQLTADSNLIAAIGDAVAEGVTTIRVVNPAGKSSDAATTLSVLEEGLAAIRLRFPTLLLEGLAAGEIAVLAVAAGIRPEELLARLREAGLDAITSDAADISAKDWIELHRAAHRAGLRSAASVGFGAGETPEEIVDRLLSIRALQDETGGFTACTLTGFRPNTPRAEFEEPTAVEYLRTLAITRMVLENVANIESSCVKEGLKVMQMALRFGANDGGRIGGSPAAAPARFTESDLRRVIRDAGFTPVERDSLYRTMFLSN